MKVAEWIRGSQLKWTDGHHKKAMSYRNHCGRDVNFWRLFIRQCSVNQLVRIEFKSLINAKGKYSVYGIVLPTEKGKESVIKELPVMLPRQIESVEFLMKDRNISTTLSDISLNYESPTKKRNRNGKGSRILLVIRYLLTQAENWK